MLDIPTSQAQQSVEVLKGIGPARKEQLAKLGINTLSDLIFHLPVRYEDWRPVSDDMDRLLSGDMAAVAGNLKRVQPLRGSPPRTVLELETEIDGQQVTISSVLFGRRYLHRRLSPGQRIIMYGQWSKKSSDKLECSRAQIDEQARDQIIPVYPSTKNLSSKRLAGFIKQACELLLGDSEAVLPDSAWPAEEYLPLPSALSAVHQPQQKREISIARWSLAFVELTLYNLALLKSRMQWVNAPSFSHDADRSYTRELLNALPFELTSCQHKAIQQIDSDMSSDVAMYRLLQGDVGSGKTVVGAYATVKAVENNCQAAWLVPTRVLANQHYRTLCEHLEPMNINVVQLTANSDGAVRSRLARGQADVVVGTHALLQKPDELKRLSFVLIDEQQRFGVQQRAVLQDITPRPDFLMLSATPIPRTLARAFYQGLEVTTLSEMPRGPRNIKTKVVSRDKRRQVYSFAEKCLNYGMGIYVVCPTIDKTVSAAGTELTKAESWVKQVRKWIPEAKTAVLHGQTPEENKNDKLLAFDRGEIDIIVGTSLLEVGLDSQRAGVIIIEDAGQFGISELHQMRGRVGRGSQKGYCFLVDSLGKPERIEKLKILQDTLDGSKIARLDLKRRGMGDFFSSKQHGIPPFLFPDALQDKKLRKHSLRAARKIFDNHMKDILTEMLNNLYKNSLFTAQVR